MDLRIHLVMGKGLTSRIGCPIGLIEQGWVVTVAPYLAATV